MTTDLYPEKIAQLLTQGTRQMDAAILSTLAGARQNALKRQSVRSSIYTLARTSSPSSTHWTGRLIPHSTQSWVAAVLLVAVVIVGAGYWQNVQEQQIDDTDLAILTDEIPIDVFVD